MTQQCCECGQDSRDQYCPECWEQLQLQLWEQQRWDRLSPAQREAAIRDALRLSNR